MTTDEINRVFERLGLPDRVKAGEPVTLRHFFAMARAISEELDEMRDRTIRLDTESIGPMISVQELCEMMDRTNREMGGPYHLDLVTYDDISAGQDDENRHA